MRRRQKYSVFNNFNRHFHAGVWDPNYFDEYVNEFSEEIFEQQPTFRDEIGPGHNQSLYNNSLNSFTNWSSQPRNGEYTDD